MRRQQPAERPRRHRLVQPFVAVPLETLDAALAFGQRPPGIDLIDADAVAAQRRRRVAGQRHQPALRHGVRPELRLADVGVDRADVDDRAAAARLHRLHSLLQQQERGAQVDVDDRVPQLDGRVLEVAARDAGGVVHQHVDAAEALDGQTRDPAAGVDRGEIAGNVHRLPPLVPQPFGNPAGLVGFEAVNHHAGAERGKVLGDAETDAGRGSGDQRDLAVEGCHGRSETTGSIGGRDEHGLDHPAIVHRVEGIAPAVERRAQADDRLRHRQAAIEQMDHALPHPVVVAERPLQADVAHHQRIDVHGDDVGRPADLDDVPVRAREPQRDLERVARARRVAHHVGAERGMAADDCPEILRLHVDRARRAEPCCRLEPRLVAREPSHDQRIGPRQRRHARAQQPDRPGPEDHDGVARAHGGIHAHRVERDRMRLGQAGDIERQRVRHVVEAAGSHAHVAGHRAVDPVAEPLARRAQVVASAPAHQAVAADARRRLADHPIAFAEAADARADCRDGAPELVAEDHRHVHRPRVRVARLVHVRAAHRYRPDLQQHLVVGNRRNGNLTELHREGREGVVNHGGLCRHDGVGTRFGDSDSTRGGSRVSMGSMAPATRPAAAAAVF